MFLYLKTGKEVIFIQMQYEGTLRPLGNNLEW